MYRYVLLVLAALALTHVQAKEKCPSVVGKYPFDDSKFNGQWFSIAGIRHKSTTVDKKCKQLNITSVRTGSESSMSMICTYKSNDKTHSIEGYGQAYKPEKSSLSYGVWKKEGETSFSGVYKMAVVATDYDNYSIFLSCKPTFDETTKTFGRSLYAEIWGRKKTLGEETLKTLKNILSGYDINESDLKTTDHSDC